jgi:pimeloyl-ACP methyl ester carboxylesterase
VAAARGDEETVSVQLFTIDTPEPVLADLRERLSRTRLPDEADGGGWLLGTDLAYLRSLIDYWRNEFDWRAIEARLNAFPQYTTEIDGIRIHFVHVRGRGEQPLPLVLTNGWPSTFAELLPLVPLLTDPTTHGGNPADAFDVIIPSLPGFGYSSPHTRRGPRRIHDTWATLMSELGYERFGACGRDIGARVTSRLGFYHSQRVVGIHLDGVDLEWPNPLPDDLSELEREYVARCEQWDREEGAYAAVQSTRPQTLAYGLCDSPAGLAAWIVEKFRAWSDCAGDITTRFDFDEILTTVTLYWVTNTINSANRNYYESRHDPAPLRLPPGTRIEVPAGFALFPGEAEPLVPRAFAERCYRITRWTDMPRGGHFPALEEPELLAEDIRAFFRPLRQEADARPFK